MKSVEQQARDLLERLEVEHAQTYSAGEIIELAELINDVHRHRLVAGRVEHVRTICERSIELDRDRYPDIPGARTDRSWLAQSVLNILDGKSET